MSQTVVGLNEWLPHVRIINDTISFDLLRVKKAYAPLRLPTELASLLYRPDSLEAYF